MITILPEGPLPFFPDIVFLAGSASYQLYRIWDGIPTAIIKYKQVIMLCEAPYYVKLISSNSVFCIHFYHLFNNLVHIIVALC